jgi:hypothetical protein
MNFGNADQLYRKSGVGPGARRQPSPEGLGGGYPRLWSAGGAALHSSPGAAPLALKRNCGIDVPALPRISGGICGTRPRLAGLRFIQVCIFDGWGVRSALPGKPHLFFKL